MQTNLSETSRRLARADEAESILRHYLIRHRLAATWAIRAGGRSRDAWVIAVTANTLVHDREHRHVPHLPAAGR